MLDPESLHKQFAWLPAWINRINIGLAALGYFGFIGWILRPARIDKFRLECQLLAMRRLLGFDQESTSRISLLIPAFDWRKIFSKDKMVLKTVTDVMPGHQSPELKTLNINQGVVGATYRTREARISKVDDDASDREHRQILIDTWGFTEHEANAINKDKKIVLAVPVFDGHMRLKGIIVIDAEREEDFEGVDPEGVLDSAAQLSVMIEPLI